MRHTLLAVVLLGLALSGCIGAEPEEKLETGDDDQRRSVGGGADGNNTDAPHTKVPLLDVAYEVAGQSTLTFDIELPANTTNVDVILSWPGPAHERASFTAALDGCGSFSDPTVAGVYGGGGSLRGRLCKDAAPGKHTLTVSADGFIQGSLRLEGQRPLGNATAAP